MKNLTLRLVVAAALCVANCGCAKANGFTDEPAVSDEPTFAELMGDDGDDETSDEPTEDGAEKGGFDEPTFAELMEGGSSKGSMARIFARPLGAVSKQSTFDADVVTRPDASSELVNVDMRLAGTKRKESIFYLGDQIEITVTSTVDGYLYLFGVDCEGKPTLLLPNKRHSDNRVKAKKAQLYPTAEMDFEFEVLDGKMGAEKVVAYVTEKPLATAKSVDLDEKCTELSETTARQLLVELDERIDENVEGRKSLGVKAKKQSAATHGVCSFTTVGSPRPTDGPQPLASKPKRIVFCVGVDVYQDSRIRPLTLCAKDARGFAAAAKKYLGADDVYVLTDKKATLANIRKAFSVLERLTEKNPDSEIMIFMSMHGGKIATVQNEKNDAYLVPYDGNLSDPLETMLTEDDFGKMIQDRLKGRKVMVFVDGCFSAALLEEGGSKGIAFGVDVLARAKSIGGDGVYALTSSTADQKSFEAKAKDGYSVMTYFLLEEFKNCGKGTKHIELKARIQPKVARYVKDLNGYEQTVVDYDGLRPGIVLRRD